MIPTQGSAVVTIASYPAYADAQAAVDSLSDRGFPVERLQIVASGLRFVEQITGRRGYPQATGSTASSRGCPGRGNDPFFVQSRHEEMSAFMACAHAQWTGEVGVCTATSGPGAIPPAPGDLTSTRSSTISPSWRSSVRPPARRSAARTSAEIDLISLFKDVASDCVTMATVPEQIPP